MEASGERSVAAGRDMGAGRLATGAVTGPVRYLLRRTVQFVGGNVNQPYWARRSRRPVGSWCMPRTGSVG